MLPATAAAAGVAAEAISASRQRRALFQPQTGTGNRPRVVIPSGAASQAAITAVGLAASRRTSGVPRPPVQKPPVQPPATKPPASTLERIREAQRQRVLSRVGSRGGGGPGVVSQFAGAVGIGSLARFAGPAAAIAAPVLAARFAINRLGRRTDELAELSPAIARQRAINEVLREQRNIRVAREQGPQLAELERLKGAASRATEGFLDRQQAKLLDRFGGGEGINEFFQKAVDSLGGPEQLEKIIERFDKLPEALKLLPGVEQVQQMLELLQEMNRELKDSKKTEFGPSPIEKLLDDLHHLDDSPPEIKKSKAVAPVVALPLP